MAATGFNTSYIEGRLLSPHELEYELYIRNLELTKGESRRWSTFYDAQLKEAKAKQPTQFRASSPDRDINGLIKSLSELFTIVDENGNPERAIREVVHAKLKHVRARIGRFSGTASQFGKQIGEITAGTNTIEAKWNTILNALLQTRHTNANTSEILNLETEQSELDALRTRNQRLLDPTAQEFLPSTSHAIINDCTPREQVQDLDADRQPSGNKMREIEVNHADLTEKHATTITTPDMYEKCYESIAEHMRRETQAFCMPIATSSAHKEKRNNEPDTPNPFELLVQNLDRWKSETLTKIQQNLSDQFEILRCSLQSTTRKTTKTEAETKSSEPAGRKTKKRRDSSSESSSSESSSTSSSTTSASEESSCPENENKSRRKRHNRRRPTNPGQWNFMFSGEKKSSNNNKEVTAQVFMSMLNSFRKSERLSKRDTLGCLNQLFVGAARKWWNVHGGSIKKFSDFEKKFRKEWLPKDFSIEMECALMQLKQNDTPISTFLIEFESQASFIKPKLRGRKLVKIATDNLNDRFRNALATKRISSFAKLKEYCHRIGDAPTHENPAVNQKPPKPYEENKRFGQRSVNKQVFEVEKKETQVESESDENPHEVMYIQREPRMGQQASDVRTFKRVLQCFNCREFGHRHKDCTKARTEFCWKCGKPDVRISRCPNCSENYWATIKERAGSSANNK